MTSVFRSLLFSLFAVVLLASCSEPEPIYDLSQDTYTLFNTDSAAIDFPGHFNGEISVITFVYTHCPDVCPVITANMKNIRNGLRDTSGIKFIEISFDPDRDSPSVLKSYKNLYQLDKQFTLLTGDTATVGSLLDRLEIVAEKTIIDSLGQDSSNYYMMHSNTIYLMDDVGQIRAEYAASVVPPENVIEDIQILRDE